MQFYNADVYLVLALVVFVLGYLLYRLVHCCCFAALAKLGFSKRKVELIHLLIKTLYLTDFCTCNYII